MLQLFVYDPCALFTGKTTSQLSKTNKQTKFSICVIVKKERSNKQSVQ